MNFPFNPLRTTLASLLFLILGSGSILPAKVAPQTFEGTECSRLWPRLNLEAPALSEVQARVQSGDATGAMQALNTYFLTRFPKNKIDVKSSSGMQETADAALTLHFRSRSSEQYYLLHQDFEWNKNPEGIKDHHWISLLASLNDLQTLADMYIKTGDEKYARGCAALFDDWATHCPPGSGAPSWSLATTMIRQGIFLRVFERMLQWPNWPREQEARFLNFIAMQADIMAEKRGPGNQDCTNSEHLLRSARIFPEFKNAAHWSQTGFDRLNGKILTDTLDDGSTVELCSGYHKDAVETYTHTLQEFQDDGKEVSPAFSARLEKMYEWIMKISLPDGVLPLNGDSGAGNTREFLRKGADLFHRPDMAYVGSGGKTGTPPAYLDAALPAAGYYTLRSGWTGPDDLYLFMDISTQPVVSHQYFDALHIFLYAYGREFFPATGTFTYGGDYHETARATRSANTVTIDNENQGDVPSVCNAFFSSPQLSFLDGSQPGYPGVTHRRQVLFVRPAPGAMPYFLLVDRLTGNGSRRADQLFHFPPGNLQVDAAKAQAQTTFPSGGNILVANLVSKGLTTEMFPDEMHPKQGETVARPGLRFHQDGELPMTFVTLLLPYRGKTPPAYSASIVPMGTDPGVPAGGDVVAVQVKYGAVTDVLFTAPEPDMVRGVNTRARAGLIRTMADGTKLVYVP
jgi:hypothetical protein